MHDLSPLAWLSCISGGLNLGSADLSIAMNCRESFAIINIYKIVECIHGLLQWKESFFIKFPPQRILLPHYYTIKNLYLIGSGL